jgi:hypothetical protein
MFDFLRFIIIFFLGFIIGRIWQLFELRTRILKIYKDRDIDISTITEDKEDIPNYIRLEIDKVDNTILLYNSFTNEFICQSSSIEEAAEKFNKIKKNIPGIVVYENKKIFFINGKIIKDIKAFQ